MYIPLGGRQKAHLNVWPIFTFVALWHDLSMRLFAWGWLICLFLLPEFAAMYLSKRLKVKSQELLHLSIEELFSGIPCLIIGIFVLWGERSMFS